MPRTQLDTDSLSLNNNLTLSATSSPWGAAYRVIDFTTGCALYGSGVLTGIASNSYFDGTNWIYKTATSTGRFDVNGNTHRWFIAASGSVGGTISYTQAMTLSSSGNLLVNSTGTDDGVNKLQVAGNVAVKTVGSGLRVSEGTNAKQGVATLAAGTVTVTNTSVTASSRIFLTTQSPGGTVGCPYISARTVGTSFTITSTSNTDTSVIAYQIFEPA